MSVSRLACRFPFPSPLLFTVQAKPSTPGPREKGKHYYREMAVECAAPAAFDMKGAAVVEG